MSAGLLTSLESMYIAEGNTAKGSMKGMGVLKEREKSSMLDKEVKSDARLSRDPKPTSLVLYNE
jgi:hypothetical protein